ncbi:MAG: deoxyribose-phosphate aldolase [Chloroflexi bacterium AL-W]|nr:deoxyribose-phosphate aldolase [Chloroflexi bacterium AL-N1]NOK68968.1 deoxyribose-phosphate aldolase [Chloroflexi bacterium AL-N10]NOK76951.1 deoxyribose-phosphate aldolase [Chloroflexi bacterium AL-N5]NOK82661.1 deoxyribose-phosphate aldolase [Chloroflexi bacterium AL-W]NOK90808.1 deoxyribose-phosphate aldolase [Chloroflexi bacterium AL-N15]
MNTVASYIDHTLLKPEATPEQITQLCAEAREYTFASVCVNPSHVTLCAALLTDTQVAVCTVVGFPLGATTTEMKVFEAQHAIQQGAREVDMVLAIGHLKANADAYVLHDIQSVVEVAHGNGAICKIIIETALLTDTEKQKACELAVQAGADFVKTSTGFSSGGATVEDIQLMRRVVGPQIGVKASGGIRTLETTQAMIAAGATRIGASAGVQIVHEERGIGSNAPGDTGY